MQFYGPYLGSFIILGAPQANPTVRAIQRDLRAVGFGLRLNGQLDTATVEAVNSILSGWDDVPPHFRTGRLTAAYIRSQIGSIARYVRKAVRGATGFDRLPEG